MRRSRCPDDTQRRGGRLFRAKVRVPARDTLREVVAVPEVRQQDLPARPARCRAPRRELRPDRSFARCRPHTARAHRGKGRIIAKECGKLRQVQLRNARRAHRFLVGTAYADALDRLVEQLRLPGVEAAGRFIVRETIAEHGLERLHAAQLGEQRHQRLDVDVHVVVVAADVGRDALKPWRSGRPSGRKTLATGEALYSYLSSL